MIEFEPKLPSEPLILCLGAHCDDVEIGCGGTLQALLAGYPAARFEIVIFSGNETRRMESRRCLEQLLPDAYLELQCYDYRDGYFPAAWSEIKTSLEQLRASCDPDLIFVHHRQDAHQDHRLLGELCWNSFRDHSILEYEIPKYDGDIGRPDTFVPLTAEQLARKVEALQAHVSQQGKDWFQSNLFESLARIRGMECRSLSGFAEAFFSSKARLVFGPQ